ncbi:Germin-like protein 8-14 [Vitis vinifera]|uniref:Germin-like protein 8-14 n=1 Tax=Vitis vinifera TaxID=29760 RepID=A0A438FWJ6_VITVI|nr:Germin-like protein 8-14 [Vitis vinifera]
MKEVEIGQLLAMEERRKEEVGGGRSRKGGLRVPGHTSTLFNAAINSASVHKFPVLNGLGVSVARADIALAVCFNATRPGGSEIILVAKGSVTVGLISSIIPST